jgi:hypothetical protein
VLLIAVGFRCQVSSEQLIADSSKDRGKGAMRPKKRIEWKALSSENSEAFEPPSLLT